MFAELSTIQVILFVIIALINLYTLILFYIDKRRAVRHQRNRISEKKLLRSSISLGGVGAFLGMGAFRHKTKHRRFQIVVPVSAVVTGIVIYYILSM